MARRNLENEKKGLYINPVTDFGFKYIFEDDTILMPFIEDVLGVKIKQLTYLNGEELGRNPEDRKIIYDLLCRDSDGNEFIVEMQNGEQMFFSDRIVYYLSRRISSEIKKGEAENWEYGLTPVYGIFILNFHMHGLKPSAVRTIRLTVEETGETFNANVVAYTLELPDYRNKAESEKYTNIETWLYNIANMDKMTGDLAFKDRQPAFKRLQEKARRGNLTPEEDVEYERSLKAHRDYNAVMSFQREEGKQDGRAEGRAEGILSVAKNLKAAGVAMDLILQTTGLSKEEVEKL